MACSFGFSALNVKWVLRWIFILQLQEQQSCIHHLLTSSGVVIVIDETYLNRHHNGDVFNSAADAGGQPYLATHHQASNKATLNND